MLTQERKVAYYCIVRLEEMMLPDTVINSSCGPHVEGPGVERRAIPVVE